MKINGNKFKNVVQALKDLAEQSKMLQRHACALISGGKIMSKCVNTETRFSKHAEMNVIDDCISKGIMTKGNINKKCILIVLRISRRTGDITNSKPCCICLEYIKKHGVKKVCYSTQLGDFMIEKPCDVLTSHKTIYYRVVDRIIEQTREKKQEKLA